MINGISYAVNHAVLNIIQHAAGSVHGAVDSVHISIAGTVGRSAVGSVIRTAVCPVASCALFRTVASVASCALFRTVASIASFLLIRMIASCAGGRSRAGSLSCLAAAFLVIISVSSCRHGHGGQRKHKGQTQ